MNIPKEIIEKAIEGGWKPKVGLLHQTNKIAGCFVSTCDNVPALDPTFYRALKIPKEQALYFLEQVLDNDEDTISNFWRKWTA